MKLNFILSIMFLITLGCKNPKKEGKIIKEPYENHPEKKVCDDNFDSFFYIFSKDSVFQKTRVKYPIKVQFYENANYVDLKYNYIFSSMDFEFIDFTNDENAIHDETGKFTIEKKISKKSIIYSRVGYDNGILISYKFDLIDCKWYLVEIIDEST